MMTPLPEEHLHPGHFTSQYNTSQRRTTMCNTSSCKRASQASVHSAQRRTLCNTNIWHHSAITVGESSLRPTLTTLETNSYNSYNTLPSAHFLSQGKVSHTCTKVQHGWALLMLMLAINKVTFVRIEKAIIHFGIDNKKTEQSLVCTQLVLPSMFECLPCETFVRQEKHLSARDNKHLKTATVTGFTQI